MPLAAALRRTRQAVSCTTAPAKDKQISGTWGFALPPSAAASSLALRQAILPGVLVAREAHIEDAALQELAAGRRLLLLADLHGMLALLLLA
eukprot:CAMPEP_0115296970 /NCGR_PEP_ID=MMETSP0270-20121206/67510_1 /TAXON_ID=71861 /ORGANISM="Scrippsiella trochoidea, Strain CCMP3099" /LENGTH=91 /DNA_ID=CAMNT_0002714619 /DNA_START=94 /DNA_END=366 /DNA_ORIENTATION=+